MATTLVGERMDRAGSKERGSRTFSREFLVKSTSKHDSVPTVLNTTGLPAIGSIYAAGNDSDFTAPCRQLSASQPFASWEYWEVVANYSTQERDEPDEDEDDPDVTPSGLTWSTHTEEVTYFETKIDFVQPSRNPAKPFAQRITTDAIANTAGDPFDPQPTVIEYFPILHTETFTSWIVDAIGEIGLLGKVNNAVWAGALAKTIKYIEFDAQPDVKKGKRGTTVRRSFLYKPLGHRLEVLDIGPNFLNEVGTKFAAVDDNGAFVDVLLNGDDGQKATDGSHILFFDLVDAVDLNKIRPRGHGEIFTPANQL